MPGFFDAVACPEMLTWQCPYPTTKRSSCQGENGRQGNLQSHLVLRAWNPALCAVTLAR